MLFCKLGTMFYLHQSLDSCALLIKNQKSRQPNFYFIVLKETKGEILLHFKSPTITND